VSDQRREEREPAVLVEESDPYKNGRRWMRADFFSAEVVRLALLVAVVTLTVALLYFTPLNVFLKDLSRLQNFFDRGHALPELLFFLLTAVLVAAGVSRLFLGGVAGMLFGFWEGLLVVQMGSLAGAYLTYRSVRWGGRSWFKARIRNYPAIEKIIHTRPSVLFVFMLRQMPLPGFVVNAGLGLGAVKSSTFLAGSFLGWLPQGIIVALMGDALTEGQTGEVWVQLLVAGILVFTAAVFLGIKKRFFKNETI
jgi:uncharacterized membrane protein YdjX (TVP38/TMEM64 family)